MRERIILHADMNNAYASIEMLHRPKLRGRPLAVGGSVEERHGIILSRNYEARAYGVKVAEPLWQARQKCPHLTIVPPDFDKYLRFSGLFRRILSDYSDQVEPFGIDESWVDVTGSTSLFGSGREMADAIRGRTKSELGLTVSVGVSFNKIFAKLGSDLKKPDATTEITPDNYREIAWPRPVSDLMGVGPATKAKLGSYGITTIGRLARVSPRWLRSVMGLPGLMLHACANGHDSSPVKPSGYEREVKSVGNSTTCPRDLENEREARIVFQNLAENVAARLRKLGLAAGLVQISLRGNDLLWFERQTVLPVPSMISSELTGAAMKLLRNHYGWHKPLRSVGLRAAGLVSLKEARQLALFDHGPDRERAERMEYVIDDIRRRFGHGAISTALLLTDKRLTRLNVHDGVVINPFGRN